VGLVVLDEVDGLANLLVELGLVVGLEEMAAIVAKNFRF
jgi:hypothetical protein